MEGGLGLLPAGEAAFALLAPAAGDRVTADVDDELPGAAPPDASPHGGLLSPSRTEDQFTAEVGEVDLVEGRGEHYWPRPGRILAASRTHTFAQLADAIDDAFARWDRAHLHAFTLSDGTRLETPYEDWEDGPPALDDRRTRLGRLRLGEQFAYVFDFGDDWTHLCTVGEERVDPDEVLGIVPSDPLPFWGWGDLPDQYRRRWDGDDGESQPPKDPGRSDLPPLRPWWGRQNGGGTP